MLQLRKKWVVELPLELFVPKLKLRLLAEEIMYRLRMGELKINTAETIAIIAYYYAYKHFY